MENWPTGRRFCWQLWCVVLDPGRGRAFHCHYIVHCVCVFRGLHTSTMWMQHKADPRSQASGTSYNPLLSIPSTDCGCQPCRTMYKWLQHRPGMWEFQSARMTASQGETSNLHWSTGYLWVEGHRKCLLPTRLHKPDLPTWRWEVAAIVVCVISSPLFQIDCKLAMTDAWHDWLCKPADNAHSDALAAAEDPLQACLCVSHSSTTLYQHSHAKRDFDLDGVFPFK